MVKSTLGQATISSGEFWMMMKHTDEPALDICHNVPIDEEKIFSCRSYCCRAAFKVAEKNMNQHHKDNGAKIEKKHVEKMAKFEKEWEKRKSDHYFTCKKATFEMAERLKDQRKRHLEKCAKDIDSRFGDAGKEGWAKTAAHVNTNKKHGLKDIMQGHESRVTTAKNAHASVREKKLQMEEAKHVEYEKKQIAELKQKLSSIEESMRVQHESERARLSSMGTSLKTQAEEKHEQELFRHAQEWHSLPQFCPQHFHLNGLVARL